MVAHRIIGSNLKMKKFGQKAFAKAEVDILKEMVRSTLKTFYAGDRDEFDKVFFKTWNELNSLDKKMADFYMKKVLKGITN